MFIASEVDQNDSEVFLQLMMDSIQFITTQACVDALLPFMCQYLFPLCNTTSGGLLLPSQEECFYVSSVVCQLEWELVSLFVYDRLPFCDELPQVYPIQSSNTHSILIKSVKYMSMCTLLWP